MKQNALLLFLCIGARLFAGVQTPSGAQILSAGGGEAAIRTLENKFIAAFNTGDIDAIMKNYVQDKSFVIFDVVPRKDYRGADNYRKYWEEFFSHFKGTPTITITDLGITADNDIGFSHSIQHITGIDKQGHPVDRTVRVTDGYRKVGDRWLIALEHISVPVDLATGKMALTQKP